MWCKSNNLITYNKLFLNLTQDRSGSKSKLHCVFHFRKVSCPTGSRFISYSLEMHYMLLDVMSNFQHGTYFTTTVTQQLPSVLRGRLNGGKLIQKWQYKQKRTAASCRNQVDHDLVRVTSESTGDNEIDETPYCSVMGILVRQLVNCCALGRLLSAEGQ